MPVPSPGGQEPALSLRMAPSPRLSAGDVCLLAQALGHRQKRTETVAGAGEGKALLAKLGEGDWVVGICEREKETERVSSRRQLPSV